MSDDRKVGTVKWFNDTKGYGFIEQEDGGEDVFVHHADINCAGYRSLKQGQKVSYTLVTNAKSPKAENVEVVPPDAP
ncbi:cold-shock protein [Pseudomonas eucalypticola]|uniref:Cold-shock protein n=1 Tax=Pseudomonas eucalypticola TaxID=2599595 RepID=A0A7D5D7I2_9PSED|nr:cold-shock protein [Pseudomonas eucalypticola]QKZ04696.1 cold-shock protein [Pseudomonas eucalypticola]